MDRTYFAMLDMPMNAGRTLVCTEVPMRNATTTGVPTVAV